MPSIYSKNPIVEALCELRFLGQNDWDWTIPGLLYHEIRVEYPKKKEVRGYGVGIELKPKLTNVTSNIVEKIDRMQFLNESETRLIQVGENILTVNYLKPYNSWEEFKPIILSALKKYDKVTTPKGVLRISLRYINIFSSLPDPFEWEDYFNYHPKFPNKDQVAMAGMYMKTTIPMPNFEVKEGFMNLILADRPVIQPAKEKTSDLILDLEIIFSRNEGKLIQISEAESFIEKGHGYIKEIFESCITDNMRNILR